MSQKKVSIVIPAYNEEENIRPVTEAVVQELNENLPEYDYEIIIIDNNSQDNTRPIIRELCSENKKVRAIFNEKNFGPDSSPYYGLMQSSGDCTILFCADFQDPLEMIHKLVREWEKGYTVVTAIKTESKENKLVRFFRTVYYKTISSIPYEQQKRRAGKSHIRFFTLYDMAMKSFTSYTKIGLRMCTFFGFGLAAICFIIALVYLIRKLVHWDAFDFGIPVILIGIFFIGAVQLIFLGFIGEYILTINQRIMHRPLVVERERINFETEEKTNE